MFFPIIKRSQNFECCFFRTNPEISVGGVRRIARYIINTIYFAVKEFRECLYPKTLGARRQTSLGILKILSDVRQ